MLQSPGARHCSYQKVFHLEVEKTNLPGLLYLEAGKECRMSDIFPFDSSVVKVATPLSHIKNETLELNWHLAPVGSEQVSAGFLVLFLGEFFPPLRCDENGSMPPLIFRVKNDRRAWFRCNAGHRLRRHSDNLLSNCLKP